MEQTRFRNLAEMIFADTEDLRLQRGAPEGREQAQMSRSALGAAPDSPGPPVLLGCVEQPELRTVSLSLGQLRRALLVLGGRLAARGIAPGDTVALVRLPRTSELPAALAYLALSVWGIRVLFPMYLELDSVGEWLELTSAKALLVGQRETEGPRATDTGLVERLASVAARRGVPLLRFREDLGIHELLRDGGDGADGSELEPLLRSSAGSTETECLLLTTSGTSGHAKIVRYTQGALLRSCAAWEQAGLFHPDRLGGRGLSLLLAHSMGLRGLWNALWTRRALCLITPEWFLEHPERVSSLLVQMQPEHVTGGPATFHTLLEFARVYPQLKERCLRSLKCLVSSGSPFDGALARQVEVAFGVRLHNAFGMTETMQVLSTLVPGPHRASPGSLGNPLPGVELRLDGEGLPAGQRRLLLRSPFGFSGYLDARAPVAETSTPPRPADGWFSTGDLVEQRDDDLCYLGREEADFINDGLGLKISRLRLERLYAPPELDGAIDGVAFYPLQREPGMAALFFARASGTGAAIVDRELLGRVRSALEQRLERLRDEVEALEFGHLSVGRFAVVDAPAPRTVKGTLQLREVDRRWSSLVAQLTGQYVKSPEIVLVDRERYARSASIRLTSPRVGELMRLLELDKHYVRGEGDRLYYRDGEAEREVVDFVGGYGGNLLGHRHPALLEAMQGFLSGGHVPLFDQGSARPEQGELARKLVLAVGGLTGSSYVVRFGSTGAEAVELALAHACLERDEQIRRLVRDQKRRFGHRCPERVRELTALIRERLAEQPPRILAVEGAYHGHTLGARSVVFNAKMRKPLVSLAALEPIFIPRDAGAEKLDAIVAAERIAVRVLEERQGRVEEQTVALSRIIAAIAEPIQGEGGVREVPPALLRQLAGFDFPLIVDEIQTGLGRCGRLLASEGVPADYYLLSKALGGGLVKIAAVLIARSRYRPRFDELYASTFAGDALSSVVAGRVLELVSAERIPERCRERGEALRRALESVRQAYPEAIREVRGRGLLLAVELDRRCAASSFLLRTVAEREMLGALAASYLLNRHGVRVLPTLSAPDVLRVEPSAFVDDAAIERLCRGLGALGEKLRDGDTASLLAHLVRQEELLPGEPEDTITSLAMSIEEPRPGASRVAFIIHFVFPERELSMSDPSLRRLPPAARRALAARMMELMELKPTLAFARNLFGGRVWFATILIPADVAQLETLHRMDYRFLETERLQEAVDLAAGLGCTCVALGGYTSIIARDGEAVLPPEGVQVTSGNAFTVVVGARRIAEACAAAGIDASSAESRVGVVGATGNIGSSLIRRLLAGPRGFSRALMVGRNPERLERLRRELDDGRVELQATTDLAELRRCNVVAIATNTNEPLIYPEHLQHDRPVVIADVSVPSAVSRQVRGLGHVHVVPLAGTVAVPGAPELRLSSHTPPGTAFCCAAEAMLIGLEPEATAGLRLTGEIDPRSMEVLDQLGEKHGLFTAFGKGGFKRG